MGNSIAHADFPQLALSKKEQPGTSSIDVELLNWYDCSTMKTAVILHKKLNSSQNVSWFAMLMLVTGGIADGQSGNGTFTTIDYPGAAYTLAVAVNDTGLIAGWYLDTNSVYHGFLRDRSGNLTSFDAPGSGTGNLQGTMSRAINATGTITGSYTDENSRFHGFIRKANGDFITFDAVPLDTPQYSGTAPESISIEGAVAGIYDAPGPQGFVRLPDGTITTFGAPGGGLTFANAISAEGIVAGYTYSDISGFLRGPQGDFTTFNVPGADLTSPNAINAAGMTAGQYFDDQNVSHGFVRDALGRIVTFDPSATEGHGGTVPLGINSSGTVAGTYMDANSVAHGFLRSQRGAIVTFEAPSAGTQTGQGTSPRSINNSGLIVGAYVDANGLTHGFLRQP